MAIYQCNGCKKSFKKERGLSTHFQHNHECKMIHYQLDATKHPPSQTYTNDNSFDTKKKLLNNNSTKSYTSQTEIYKSLSKIINNLGMDNDNNNKHLMNEDIIENCQDKYEFMTNNLDDNEIHEEHTLQNQNYNMTNNTNNSQFSFHNDDRIENNLLKLMKEINAPNYAYKKL